MADDRSLHLHDPPQPLRQNNQARASTANGNMDVVDSWAACLTGGRFDPSLFAPNAQVWHSVNDGTTASQSLRAPLISYREFYADLRPESVEVSRQRGRRAPALHDAPHGS